MTTTTPTTIDTLRAAYTRATETEAQLSTTAEQYRKRLPEIARELAVAMADGDGKRVNALRDERAKIEAELRDIEPAIRVAMERTREADKRLALAETPALFASFRSDVERFVELINEANRLASRIRAGRRDYHSRFSACGHSAPREHPEHADRAMVMGHVPARIMALLSDYTDQTL